MTDNPTAYVMPAPRTGEDREGWLEDYAYFTAAIGMIDWTALEQEPRQ